MGGRRAVSLREALGTSRTYPKLERELAEGLANKDPKAVSRAASDLAEKTISNAALTSHLSLFVPFIKQELGTPSAQRDLRSDVRGEWARLKRAHGIHVSDAVNTSVVQAVIEFLKARS